MEREPYYRGVNSGPPHRSWNMDNVKYNQLYVSYYYECKFVHEIYRMWFVTVCLYTHIVYMHAYIVYIYIYIYMVVDRILDMEKRFDMDR